MIETIFFILGGLLLLGLASISLFLCFGILFWELKHGGMKTDIYYRDKYRNCK